MSQRPVPLHHPSCRPTCEKRNGTKVTTIICNITISVQNIQRLETSIVIIVNKNMDFIGVLSFILNVKYKITSVCVSHFTGQFSTSALLAVSSVVQRSAHRTCNQLLGHKRAHWCLRGGWNRWPLAAEGPSDSCTFFRYPLIENMSNT